MYVCMFYSITNGFSSSLVPHQAVVKLHRCHSLGKEHDRLLPLIVSLRILLLYPAMLGETHTWEHDYPSTY